MELGDETLFVRQLAYEWAQLKLPAYRLSYMDYIRIVSDLQESTKDLVKTRTIFKAVLKQAGQLTKSSEWV